MNLTFSYPRPFPSIEAMGSAMYAVQWIYVIAAIVAIAMAWHWRGKNRGPLAAALYYGITLFPALGFINIFPMRYSFVADHFQYLSGLGLIVLTVAGLAPVLQKLRHRPAALAAIAAVAVALLTGQSWLQAHIYESPESLYRDTLAKNPDSWMAADNLGIELIKQGEQMQREAISDQSQGDTDSVADDNKQATDHFQEAEKWFHHALALRRRITRRITRWVCSIVRPAAGRKPRRRSRPPSIWTRRMIHTTSSPRRTSITPKSSITIIPASMFAPGSIKPSIWRSSRASDQPISPSRI